MDLNFHGTDDQLELYARGKLPPPEVVVIEEHLLVCESCRDRLEQEENWSLAAQEALSRDAEEESEAGWRSWPLFSWSGSGWVRQPVGAMAVALLILAAGFVFYWNGRLNLAPVAVLELSAMRGDMAAISSAREIDLTLKDAPAGDTLRVQVVDAGGASEWQGTATGNAQGARVAIRRVLKPGTYFVRLYGPGGQMLHEYGFRVRG